MKLPLKKSGAFLPLYVRSNMKGVKKIRVTHGRLGGQKIRVTHGHLGGVRKKEVTDTEFP